MSPQRPDDRSRLVSVEGGRVYAIDRGPAEAELPPLVLLHGLLVTHHSFRRIIDGLAATRRVIAIDLPGGGESDRPPPHAAGDYSLTWIAGRVQEALAELGVQEHDLLAHSFGGAVAVQLVTTAPPLTRRLMLVDPVVFTMELPLEGRMALLPRLGPMLFTQLYRRADLHRYLSRVLSTPELLDESAVDLYWDRLARHGGREAAYAMLLQMSRLDGLRDRLERVPVPTTVVWGDRDGLMPVSTGERLVQLLPEAQLRVVEGCGHAVAEERPEALRELIDEHLGRTEAHS
ncbi:MAG: alpha/beta fold hydrolase [Nannocystaceae bacterium]